MLVKFDHITYVVNKSNLALAKQLLANGGYVERFCEENVDNPSCKIAYLSPLNTKHSLYFFDSPSGIPVEIVSYVYTTQNLQPLDFKLGSFNVLCRTGIIQDSLDFYKVLGAYATENGTLEIKGLLDKKAVCITFKEMHGFATNLDNEGWCCPTLIVDSYMKTKKQLENSGYFCTEADVMSVNGRNLFVFFAVGKNKEIVEIISSK